MLWQKKWQTFRSDWWLSLDPKLLPRSETARLLNHSEAVIDEEHLGADAVKQQLCRAGPSERPLQGVGADVGSVLQDVLGDLLDVGIIVLWRVWNRFTGELQKALSLLECEAHVCGETNIRRRGNREEPGVEENPQHMGVFYSGGLLSITASCLTHVSAAEPSSSCFWNRRRCRKCLRAAPERPTREQSEDGAKGKSAAAWLQRLPEAGEEVRGLQVRRFRMGWHADSSRHTIMLLTRNAHSAI